MGWHSIPVLWVLSKLIHGTGRKSQVLHDYHCQGHSGHCLEPSDVDGISIYLALRWDRIPSLPRSAIAFRKICSWKPSSELLLVIEAGTHEGMRKYPLIARKPEDKSLQVCKRRWRPPVGKGSVWQTLMFRICCGTPGWWRLILDSPDIFLFIAASALEKIGLLLSSSN